MPELPEVETVVRTLVPQIRGLTIDTMTVLHAKSLQTPDIHAVSALAGAKILDVKRRAKVILVSLQPISSKRKLVMAFHLKMTGKFFVHPEGTAPFKHTRIIFDLVGADEYRVRLFFDDMRTFGYCRVMWEDELCAWEFWRRLGIEPLDVSKKEIATRLARHSGNIKAVLLNQEIVVGIGNIYADESLFRAGISPKTKVGDLSFHQLESLGKAIKDVLEQSIAECGSSIRDYRDANGDAGSFQNSFFVYGRKGQKCLVCGFYLETGKIAGRTTVFCSHCQK